MKSNLWLLAFLFLCLSPVFAATENSPETSSESEEEVTLKYASPLVAGLDLQFSQVDFKQYVYDDGTSMTAPAYCLHLGLEWLPVRTFGKLGIGFETGFLISDVQNLNNGRRNKMVGFPLNAFVSYRFEYLFRQFLIPYVRTGVDFALASGWDEGTGGSSAYRAYTGWDWFVGMEFNLNTLEPSAAKNLDYATGINASYITLSYGASSPLSLGGSSIDLSHRVFRLGLRFEM